MTRRRFLSATGTTATAAALLSALSGCGSPRTSSSPGTRDSGAVTLGVLPFLDYVAWQATKHLGIDKTIDLQLELQQFSLEPGETAALARGTCDVASGALGSLVPLQPKTPDMRIIGTTSQFRGFAFIVRNEDGFRPYAPPAEGASPKEASRAAIAQLRGKKIVTIPSSFQATIDGTLTTAGLTEKDVTILSFDQSASAAIAFIRGEGDVFLGGLPETVRLLTGANKGKYLPLVQNQQIGEAGLWYSNFATTTKMLDQRHEIVLKLIAVWYRTARYIRERPDDALGPMVDYLNRQTGGGLTLQDAKNQIPAFVYFPTLDEAKKTVYDSTSDTYWRKCFDYQAAANEKAGHVPAGFPADWIIAEDLFTELLGKKELVDFVNSSL
ncbi:ABC transporter substrate-binding protein [Nonomuraea sp. NPDC048901]|uniref:ABC transporter substrate-binding protein n=1 Tax=Nonomuraea sp. NPDC048901 TaxID=3155627 RepID=UPI0033C4D02E